MSETADEVGRLYTLYRQGVHTPETRAANARYHRGARMARRAAARAYGRGTPFSPLRLRSVCATIARAARGMRGDAARIEQLCAARAVISEEIDTLVARLIDSGEKPFRIGLLLDEPPR